jgi:hypothetical protein
MMDTNLVGPAGVYAARCGTGTKTSLRPLGYASAGAVNDSWDPPSDLPRWRGRGLNYPLSLPISRYLFEHGYCRTLSWVSALNTRSLRIQLRQGKRKIAIILGLWLRPIDGQEGSG